jgi:hypothetical protein
MNTALIKPQWSPVTIALMVAGFIVFWPLGLAVLGYILWGEKFGGSPEQARSWMNRQRANWGGCGARNYERHGFGRHSVSGNAAFDEYRAEQLRHLEEERRRLDEEVHAFHDYMRNLRMAKDREEFDRFMRDRSNPQPYSPNETNGNNTSF